MKPYDNFVKNAAKRQDKDPSGFLDVVAHGSPQKIEVQVNGKSLIVDHRMAAKLIRNNNGENNKLGKTHNYVTKKQYSSEQELRNDLAILNEWGITIDNVSIFKPAKGTWISEGTAAKQKGQFTNEVRNGGAYQGLIDVNNLPKSSWIKTTKLPKSFKNEK